MSVNTKITREVIEIFTNPQISGFVADIGQVVRYSGNLFSKVGPGATDFILWTDGPEALALPPTETSGVVSLNHRQSYVGFDTSAGNGTLNLLQAATCRGKIVIVKKTALVNSVIINVFAGDTIEGVLTTYRLSGWNGCVILQSMGGTNWRLLAHGGATTVFRQSVPEELYLSRFPDIDGQGASIKMRVIRETVFNFDDVGIRIGSVAALVKFGGNITIPGDPPGKFRVYVGGTEGNVDGTLVADIAMPNSAFNVYQPVTLDFAFTPPGTGAQFIKMVLVTPNGPGTELQFSFARGINLGFEKA